MTRTLRGLLATLPLALLGSALILPPGTRSRAGVGQPVRQLRQLRERTGATRSRCRRTARGSSRSTRPDDRLEIFAVGRRRPVARRLGAGRPRAGRGRGAHRRRGLGRQPSLRLGQHRRRRREPAARDRARCSSATSRATSCSPDRAISAPSSPRRAAARTARSTPQLTTAGHRRAPSCRCSTRRRSPPTPRSPARRSPTSSCSATRRARWRAAPTATRSTPPSSSPATRRRRSARARCATAARRRRPCGALLQFPGGLPAPNIERRGHPRPRGRPDRPVRPRRAASGRTSSAATGAARVSFDLPDLDVFAIDASAATPVADRELRARRHRAVRHGDQPGQRQGLRQQHRGAERGALRGSGPRLRQRHRAGPPARGAHHRARRRERAPAAPEQAHRLRAASRAGRREGAQPRHADRHGGHRRRRDALRRRVRLEQVGVFGTARARERHLRSRRRDPHRAERRRPDRPRARRGARPRSTCFTRFDNAVSVVNSRPRTEMAHLPRPHPGAGGGPERPARSSTTRASRRATARRRARAVTSSATSTASPGTSATPTTSSCRTPCPSRSRSRRDHEFHPLKGPMTTQSLRGMANDGSMHWRGDRTGGNDPPASIRSTRTPRSRSSTSRSRR